MPSTDAMLSEHRAALREAPDQLESLCADAVLGTSVKMVLASCLNRGPVGARGRMMDGCTRHSVLSATVKVAASCRGRGAIETRRERRARENVRNEQ